MVSTLSAEMLRAFEHLPDLYLILSPELEILTVSNTFLEPTFFRKEELINRPVLEVFASEPGTVEFETIANLETSLRQVLKTKKPHQMAYQRYDVLLENGTHTERYWKPLNYPVLDARGEISYIIHKVENVTEQVKADFILDTIDGAFIQLDKNYRLLFINKIALGLLGKTEPDLVGKIFWEAFPQAMGAAGYQAITNACTQQVKVETEYFSPIFARWVYLSVAPTHNGVVLFFYDRQDIKETQLRLQKSETLLREAEKVAGTGSYEVDLLTNIFHFSDGLFRIFGEEPNAFTPSLDFIDSRSNPDDAANVRKVLEQAAADKKPYFYTRRIRHTDGSWRTVESHGRVITNLAREAIKFMGVVQDVTERKKAEKALKQSEEEFRLYVTASSEVVYKMNPNWKEMHQLEGKDFLESVQETSHNWLENFIPAEERNLVETAIAKAIQTKTIFDLEHRVNKADGTIGWTHSRAIPMLDENGEITAWIGTASDITERKIADQELKENKEQFEAAINVSPVGLGFLKSIRNENNEIIDFLFYWVSKSGKELARKDLTGRQLLSEFPFLRGTGLIEKFVNTVENDVPTDSEDHYQTVNTNIWLRWKAVKLDDGLFISVEDITPRKYAEQEIVKNLAVLKQSEDVAQIGSWEYVLENGAFTWSEGMYRLFDLPFNEPVSLQVYHEFAVPEDQPIVAELIRQITEPDEPIEETLRIKVNDQQRTLRIKAIVLRNDENKPVRVLGVDMDISEIVQLEQENLDLRLSQQKALLLAILEAQEEERSRISESLHNGVGQILYATKLNLNQVAEMVPKKALKPVEDLLSEAISETRRVSHELVPFILQDFGIVEGIADLCRRYFNSSFRLSCQVKNLPSRLEKYLEIAIYRICQELINNIVNHAEASEAYLILQHEGQEMLLQIEDNGKGIENNNRKTGIGFHMISDRVNLLNGSINISTPPTGKGTLISIRIPIE